MVRYEIADLKAEAFPALVIPVCEDREIHEAPEILAAVAAAGEFPEFTGKKEHELLLPSPAGLAARRVLFMGVGAFEHLTPETFRAMAGKAVSRCIGRDLPRVTFAVPPAAMLPRGPDDGAFPKALMEGACLANHHFDRYKKEKKHAPLRTIGLLAGSTPPGAGDGLPERVEAVCRGTLLAREWVSMPANLKTPERLAEEITRTARVEGLAVEVLEEGELREKGFGALMAVASGSKNPPRLVILDHAPPNPERTVALVGKGVTFDSGGLNLKASDALENMKADMAGAAAVAAATITLARLGAAVRVIGLLPLVENMPSGSAFRPGDIVTSLDGKTVEIGNTDAEGRLILIDALTHAVRTYSPDLLIDMASLTGACAMALGRKIAGVFTFDDELARLTVEAGERTHERCWRMPMPEDYKELLKSDFADLRNLGSIRWGGAITAALFLSEFVGDTRWVHIDIAGTSYVKKKGDYCGPGGTGFGVRLLCDLLESLEKKAGA